MKRAVAVILCAMALVGCKENPTELYKAGVVAHNRKDYAEAARWYRKAAEQGNAMAQLHLGVYYERGQGVARDVVEAVKWYRKAAEQGNANAQACLGFMYGQGQGVPQDYEEAVKWFRTAAEQGNSVAQSDLGVLSEEGQGLPQDRVEVFKGYRKAAERGNAWAQNNLGFMYAKGDGVSKDLVLAHMWFNHATVNLPPEKRKSANEVRGALERLMTKEQIAEAQRLAREWKPKKQR